MARKNLRTDEITINIINKVKIKYKSIIFK